MVTAPATTSSTAAHYKAQVIKFSCYISNGTTIILVPTVSVTFYHSIDQLPYVVVDAQLDNDKLKVLGLSPNLASFIKLAGETQTYLINKLRLNADFQTLAQDGQGNPVSFTGFMSNPVFSFQPGMLVLRYTGMHLMSGLQGFNMNIYTSLTNQYTNVDIGQLSNPSLGELGYATDASDAILSYDISNQSSVAARLNAIIVNAMDNFTNMIGTDANQEQLNINDLVAVHNLNLNTYEKFVKPFLIGDATHAGSISSTVLPGLGDNDNPTAYVLSQVDNWLAKILFSAANFSDSIPSLCDMMRFQMNADWAGSAWLEPIQMYSDPGTNVVKAPMENITFNVANTYELPLLKVQMILPGGPDYTYNSMIPSGSPTWTVYDPAQSAQLINDAQIAAVQEATVNTFPNVLSYPQKKLSGSDLGVFYMVSPPHWISPDAVMINNAIDTNDTGGLDPNDALKAFQTLDKQTARFSQIKTGVLDQILEDTWKERFLSGSSATLTLPFCAPVQVGYNYQVQSVTDGSLIFTGYLAGVSHTIAQHGQGQATVQTQCAFSHVQVAGVTFDAISKTSLTPPALSTEQLNALDNYAIQNNQPYQEKSSLSTEQLNALDNYAIQNNQPYQEKSSLTTPAAGT
jgi:hypothetical protein